MQVRQALLSIFFATLLVSSSFLLSQSAPQHGVELADLDRKAEPCDDFYEFANGTWRANNPIPASMTRWSRRWQAGETAKDKLHDILEAAAAGEKRAQGQHHQIIGDYYGACMDESRANARGLDPIKPWFAKIDAAHDMATLQPVMAELHDILVQVPFGFGSQPDPHKPSLVLADISRQRHQPAGSRLLPEARAAVQGSSRQIRRARHQDVHARGMGPEICGGRLADGHGDGDQTRRGLTRQRCPARSRVHRSQLHLRAVAGDGPALRLGRLLPAQAHSHRRRPERRPAQVHAGIRPPAATDFARRLEGLSEVAAVEFGREFSFRAIRRGKFRLQRKVSQRRDRDEAALEALRGIRRPPARRRLWARSMSRNISRPPPRPACRRWCATCSWPCATTSSAVPG